MKIHNKNKARLQNIQMNKIKQDKYKIIYSSEGAGEGLGCRSWKSSSLLN